MFLSVPRATIGDMNKINPVTTDESPAYDELSDRDHMMLDFERAWFKHAGAKDAAIRDRFDCSATTYYAQLNTLIDRTAALVHDPFTVRRLRRLRDARAAQRSAARRGVDLA